MAMTWDKYRWPDERTLVDAVVAGDSDAAGALVDAYRGAVERASWTYLRGLFLDRESHPDLCQEAWIEILVSLSRWNAQGSLSSWIWRIVRNTAVDVKRKAGRLVQTVDDPSGNHGEVGDPGAGPEDLVERRAEWDVLRECLGTLREEYREALLLWSKGYSYREIAEILDVPVNTVSVWIHRALAKLAAHVRREHPDWLPAAASKRSTR